MEEIIDKMLRFYKTNLALIINDIKALTKDEVVHYESFMNEIYNNSNLIEKHNINELLNNSSFSEQFKWFVEKEYFSSREFKDIIKKYLPYIVINSNIKIPNKLIKNIRLSALMNDNETFENNLITYYKKDIYKMILSYEIEEGIINDIIKNKKYLPNYFLIFKDSSIYLKNTNNKLNKFKLITRDNLLRRYTKDLPNNIYNEIKNMFVPYLSEKTANKFVNESKIIQDQLIKNLENKLKNQHIKELYDLMINWFNDENPFEKIEALRKFYFSFLKNQKEDYQKPIEKINIYKIHKKKDIPRGTVIPFEKADMISDIYPNALSEKYIIVKSEKLLNAYYIKKTTNKRAYINFIGKEHIPVNLNEIEDEILKRLNKERNRYHIYINL